MFCRLRHSLVAMTLLGFFGGAAGHATEPAAPPAPQTYLWQNDPRVLNAYGLNSVSPFCLPAAIGTGILMQWFGPGMDRLHRPTGANYSKLSGIEIKPDRIQIDAPRVLLNWNERCGANKDQGAQVVNGPGCIADFYREMGLTQFDIKLYRYFGEVMELGSAKHLPRHPTPEDMIRDLREGYAVVASIAFAKTNPETGLLTRYNAHAVLVLGLAEISKDEYLVWVTNPTRQYRAELGEKNLDEVRLVRVEPSINQRLESSLTPWEWRGRLMDRPKSLSLLHAVTSFRPE
jgi:hypothetical protein